jgi:hypothetical protein
MRKFGYRTPCIKCYRLATTIQRLRLVSSTLLPQTEYTSHSQATRKWPPYCTNVSQHSVVKTLLLLFRLFQVPAGRPAVSRRKRSTGEALCHQPAAVARNSTTPPIEPPIQAVEANGKATPSMSARKAAEAASMAA